MIKKFQQYPYWKMVGLSALLFFIVVMVIKFLIALARGGDFNELIQESLSLKYIASNLVGALVYGLIISWFYTRKANKKK